MTSTRYSGSAAHSSDAIPLSAIVGISPLNPREHSDDDADIEGVAASVAASTQLQSLLVVAVGPAAFEVLDGGRRWRAMRLLVEQGAWTPDDEVNVEIVSGSEAALREIALAANTMRRALHPVEEYEAFAAMATAGFDEARIAKDFGLGERHVKQRLALGRLSPKIRAAWRAGTIGADQAQAFTAGDTHAAQDAVFDGLSPHPHDRQPFLIRKKLRSDAMSGGCPDALYVGAQGYLAAGGRIDEDLFSEEAHFRDGSLLKRLAREKLMAAGEKIAEAQGWGFVVLLDDAPDGDFLIDGEDDLDLLPEEAERLEALEEERFGALGTNVNAARRLELDAEADAIRLKALLRAIPLADRGALGVAAEIDAYGAASFTPAWKPAEPIMEDAAENASDDLPRAVSKSTISLGSKPPAPAAEKIGAPLRAVLDTAIQDAFAASIRTRPDLALMVAVARLACDSYGRGVGAIGLRRTVGETRESDSNLLARLIDRSFGDALTICAAAPLADLTSAFTEIVAAAVDVGPHIAALRDIEPLANALAARGAPLAQHLDDAFDRTAYFAAATKRACLDVAAELGTGITSGAPKASIASQVAGHAKIRGWLPEPLAAWAAIEANSPEAEPSREAQAGEGKKRPHPEEQASARVSKDEGKRKPRAKKPPPTAAEAADAAWDSAAPVPIAVDEQLRVRIHAVCDLKGGAPLFAKFLTERMRFAEGLQCKASDLRAAYLDGFEGSTPLTAQAIGSMMLDLGVAKKRLSDGYVYLGIGIIADPLDDANG